MSRTVKWILLGALVSAVLAAGCSSSGTSAALDVCVKASACDEIGADSGGLGEICSVLVMLEHTSGKIKGTGTKLSASILDCIKAAADCDGMRACVKASEAAAQVCDGAGGNDRCSSDILVECDNYPADDPDAFNCAAAGLVCGETADGAACGEETCVPESTETYCDGYLMMECEEAAGALVAVDCRYYVGVHCKSSGGGWTCQTRAGGTCGTDTEGAIACVGDGAACDEDTFDNKCDGSRIISCNHAKESTIDCEDLYSGLTCGLDGQTGAARCEPKKNECSDKTNETCQSGVITFCLFGEVIEVDCGDYGLSGCTTHDTDNKTVARCVE